MPFPPELREKAPVEKKEKTNKAYEKRKSVGIYADHCPESAGEARKAIILGEDEITIALG